MSYPYISYAEDGESRTLEVVFPDGAPDGAEAAWLVMPPSTLLVQPTGPLTGNLLPTYAGGGAIVQAILADGAPVRNLQVGVQRNRDDSGFVVRTQLAPPLIPERPQQSPAGDTGAARPGSAAAAVRAPTMGAVTLTGVDCSNRLDGAAAQQSNVGFVFRYESTASLPKDDSVAEIQDLLSHGIKVGHVFEDDWYSITPAQARTFVAKLVRNGCPTDNTHLAVMALDTNGPPSSSVADMAAAAAVLRQAGFLAGFYGHKDVARQLVRVGAIDGTWVVDTWGQDQPGDLWNFRQLPNTPNRNIGGTDCDVDDAPNPIGLLGMAPPAPPPPLPSPIVIHTGDPDVPTLIKDTVQLEPDPDGHDDSGWFTVPHAADTIVSISVSGADPAGPAGGYIKFFAPTWEDISPGITKVQVSSPDLHGANRVLTRIMVTTPAPA